ncbi:hypothetical protein J6590_008883 [Homalodisca vitripennis]|nr:hypothetical protein J6590_008883 [Homalodisca vitripennis]
MSVSVLPQIKTVTASSYPVSSVNNVVIVLLFFAPTVDGQKMLAKDELQRSVLFSVTRHKPGQTYRV